MAFDTNQFMVMKLLLNQSRKDYIMPDGKVRFPFLVMEFQAQATGGTHFVASNQVANAGAVAMEGTLELAQRISAEENVDFDEPQIKLQRPVQLPWKVPWNWPEGRFCPPKDRPRDGLYVERPRMGHFAST